MYNAGTPIEYPGTKYFSTAAPTWGTNHLALEYDKFMSWEWVDL